MICLVSFVNISKILTTDCVSHFVGGKENECLAKERKRRNIAEKLQKNTTIYIFF